MRSSISLGGAAFLLIAVAAHAESPQSFSDVPPDHDAYEAVEFLKTQNIIGGYPDGTFKPDRTVNRAEAAKIIAAPPPAAFLPPAAPICSGRMKQWCATPRSG